MRSLILIEDDASYAQVLTRRLRHYGWSTQWFSNVSDAMLANQPDVILLDQNLNGVSSLPGISQLKQNWPDTRIIVVTGYASITSTVSAIKLGADNYLTKPVEVRSLLQELDGEITADVELPERPLSVDEMEWELIQRTLQLNQNNISATARALNMHRRTLQRKLNKKRPQ